MKTEATIPMWQRSEPRGYRYTCFVGDGDSAAYKAVCALTDGAGLYATATVVNNENVNHVSKRIGTRLRQLKKDERVPRKTRREKTVMRSKLAGRDGLTDVDIDEIAGHYRQNISKHQSGDSVESLRTRILAIYYPARRTDEDPRHTSCPTGESSWCWVRRAEAAGVPPEPHGTMHLYLSGLSPELLGCVLQVFISLTQLSLLER